MNILVIRLFPVLCALLMSCSQVECEAGKLIGQHETVEFSDPSQPWSCGEPPKNANECTLASTRCEWPIVFDCGDYSVELTPSALTYVRGECRDVHEVTWK